MHQTTVVVQPRHRFLRVFRLNIFLVVVLVALGNLLFATLFAAVVEGVLQQDFGADLIVFDSLQQEFLVLVVGAPLLETFLYQYLLITVVSFLTKKLFHREHKLAVVVFPAVCFALGHTYSVYYVLVTFFGGLSLNALWVYARIKTRYPFLYVALAHALYNLCVFGLRRLG